jgi:hypothetical protein
VITSKNPGLFTPYTQVQGYKILKNSSKLSIALPSPPPPTNLVSIMVLSSVLGFPRIGKTCTSLI